MKIRKKLLASIGIVLALSLTPVSVFAEALDTTEAITEAAAETFTEANTEMAAETSTEANTETTAETEMTTEAITEMAAGASETIPEASSEADAETELSVEETELATEAGAELAGSEYDGYHTGDLEILQKIIESNDALAEYDITKPNTLDWVAWEDEGGIHGNPIRVRSLWLQNRNISGELDLSGLSYLNSLDCYSNPDLTSITLPASVTYIGCHYTGITSLEVSGCPSLEYLYCHGMLWSSFFVTLLAKKISLFDYAATLASCGVA